MGPDPKKYRVAGIASSTFAFDHVLVGPYSSSATMDAESRFRSIQLRAYEIYSLRDPASGTAEEDWRKAESQIEQD